MIDLIDVACTDMVEDAVDIRVVAFAPNARPPIVAAHNPGRRFVVDRERRVEHAEPREWQRGAGTEAEGRVEGCARFVGDEARNPFSCACQYVRPRKNRRHGFESVRHQLEPRTAEAQRRRAGSVERKVEAQVLHGDQRSTTVRRPLMNTRCSST